MREEGREKKKETREEGRGTVRNTDERRGKSEEGREKKKETRDGEKY